ncbi:bifunctional protein tyrosine phosphatase family protein/NAD(P)/FAD-dependent oxidoreductase [Stenotrophomonas sp. PS02297]|uniref:bifunctional protein tyrosine phosphatase family protein/NAD(P)/FAD-dependent oxidoreductase n=1 Tax=unclassified Stenotrophomonas TaxID=196198 RepID=UPI00249C217E|nr:bifunctional protein tyrosine phosphatase family protein/NAD(P)/FAD-dependent oxidoreductase [Stenotrophomonas sp. PS02297]
MPYTRIDDRLSVASQIAVADIAGIAEAGFTTLISNRPDGEADDQPETATLAAEAERHGLTFVHQPVVGSAIGPADVDAFEAALAQATGPTLAFCRTGTRSTTLWALGQARRRPASEVLADAQSAGYDLSALRPTLEATAPAPTQVTRDAFDVVVIGGGAAGLATMASLLKRRANLRICVVDAADQHAYQPGWTMVGAGVFNLDETLRPMASLIPDCVTWKRTAAAEFDCERNEVSLQNGECVGYRVLVVAPGLTLDWDGVPGLRAALGKNGVTSNYRQDLAPYTWQLVQQLRGGRALFTQPPMPIKCAGAPQKAMYLSADHWRRQGVLGDIDIQFHNAGAVLFGVEAYVPALMRYIERYAIGLNLGSRLVAVDGEARTATFQRQTPDGVKSDQVLGFDMLHVCPPQRAPSLVRDSALANEAGWLDVAPDTLRHVRHANVFGLGDATNTPNAKTAAAARKQAPVVAENVLATLDGLPLPAAYDGYGSCPLTVERGKIVLAEFGYGGTLMPTFPRWLIDGREPSRLAWHLKSEALPVLYWHGMLKGREWLCTPQPRVSKAEG